MWFVAQNFTVVTLKLNLHYFLPVLIAVLGFMLIFIGSFSFYRHDTTLNPLKPELASTLVRSGIYSYSRNPIYGGFVLILLGWAVYLQNIASLFCVVLFILYLNRFQIHAEEKSLEQKFGAEFEDYKNSVKRWL